MKRATAILAFAVRHGLGGLRRRSRAAAWAGVAIAAALFALGATRLLDRDVVALTSGWPGGVDMVVYLEDDVDDARLATLTAALEALPVVERVHHVPPAAALEHLRAGLGEASILDGLEPGLVPASLEVALAAGVEDVAIGHPLIERLAATPGVEDVEFVGDWVSRADALTAGLRRGGAGALWLAVGLAIVLTTSAVRLAVAGRRRPAQILAVLGGTAGFVRGPAIVQGVVIGVGGAVVGCVALALGYGELAAPVIGAVGAAVGAAPAGFLPVADLVALGGIGAAVGALGGALAVPRVAARA